MSADSIPTVIQADPSLFALWDQLDVDVRAWCTEFLTSLEAIQERYGNIDDHVIRDYIISVLHTINHPNNA